MSVSSEPARTSGYRRRIRKDDLTVLVDEDRVGRQIDERPVSPLTAARSCSSASLAGVKSMVAEATPIAR